LSRHLHSTPIPFAPAAFLRSLPLLLALSIGAKGQINQTIAFDPIPNQIFGISPFPIAAQASSLLPVSFGSTTTSVCRNADDLVILLSAGTCSIAATQSGNGNYNPAHTVTRTFTVSQALPTGTLTRAAGSPFPSGTSPIYVIAGDFNGDGKPDLAIVNNVSNNVTVVLGDGSGGFTASPGSPFAVGTNPTFVAVGDFNGDGIQDLAVANFGDNTVTVLLGNGLGRFTEAMGSPFAAGNGAYAVAVGDFNGDGIQDLAIADGGGTTVTVLLGNGSAGFTASQGSPFTVGNNPVALAVGDFNGDGIQDLAVGNYNDNTVSVLLGDGFGGFGTPMGSPLTVGTTPASVVVADFNGDGKQDLATANTFDNTVTVLLGNGSGGFTEAMNSPFAVGSYPTSVTVGDFNGDGIPDLATANDGGTNVTVLLGNGLGGFTTAAGSPFGVGSGPDAVVGGDFNGDGIQDLVAANEDDNTVTVLLGALTPTNSVLSTTSSTTSSLTIFVGQSVPLTLNVSDTGSAFNPLTGTATLMDGANALGTASQTGSPYTFSASNLAVGSHALTAVYSGGSGSAGSTSNTITIQVTPLLSISFSTGSISTITGGSVAAGFSAGGGTAPYTFAASGLPAGVTLGSGSLSGSPAQAGIFNASVTVTDANSNSASASITINVLGLTTTALPNGTVGQLYAASIGAAGGTGSFTFAAGGLPAGLSLTSYGYLNGTVKTAGTYPIAVTVSSGGLSVGGTLSLTIAPPQALSISQVNGLVTGPNGTVNVPYSQALSASGGQPPYTWSLISGTLPTGLSLSASGIVSGTPGAPGVSSFGVQATDTAGAAATAAVSITIQAAPLLITTSSLPAGMNNVDYPLQQLTVSGGVSPFTWALANGSSLPPGLTLSSDGVLQGVPGSTAASSGTGAATNRASAGATGTFTVTITVTDHAGTQASVSFPLTIRPSSAALILTSGSLAFSLSSPATSPPASQVVGVQSTVPSQPINYTISVSPAAPWLAVANGTTTPDSITVSITSAALSLGPGSYQTTITATCVSSSCAGTAQNVLVSLTVTAAPPNLQISTTLLSFATDSSASGPLAQPINLENAGGGSLGFASVSCEAAWCTAGPSPSSLAGGVSAAIPVTVNPGLLSPGFYRTQVDISTSGGSGAVPVTLFISANATMTLAPAGALFDMPVGNTPGNPNGSFLVSVNSANPVTYSAAVLSLPGVPAPSWLVLNTPGGSASSTQPGVVSFTINPFLGTPLAAGVYYGEIEIASSALSNSPEEFEVVLNVTAADAPQAPEPVPGGLLFIATGGGSVLPPQTVTVYSGSPSPLTFQASAATTDGTGWLSVTPVTGSTSTNFPGVTTVGVDTSKLTAGVYTGGVSYSLSATAVRTVNVTLIVTGSGTSGAGAASAVTSSVQPNVQPKASGCAPSMLVPAQTGLVNSFSQPAGWPTPLQIVLSNDCGGTVNNGQIVATFSNGDPPLALPLVNPGQGLYSGTWAPARASSEVSINVTASAPGYPAATSRITGAVVPNAVPVLTPNGTLHSFDPLVGAALAPGTIVAIYGQNLAAMAAQPTTIPLPTTFNGTSVIVGGMEAPLYYVSPTQVNAQIPFELQPGSQYDVIVSANGALTNSQPIQLSAATPGLAAFSNGMLIAQHSDGSLVSLTSPATAGEYLVAYLAGLGDTTVPVASGAASPTSPLAQPSAAPVLTIDGAPYPILFAGLTPGLVGLYQLNFQVPAGLPAGNLTVVVSQDGQSSNQTLLPYQP
jgi:uncharacterized protein (TIGR03437 family)